MKLSHTIVACSAISFTLLTGCSNPTTVNSPTPLNNGKEDVSLAAPMTKELSQAMTTQLGNIMGSGNLAKSISKESGKGFSFTWQGWTFANDWWNRSGSISASSFAGSIDGNFSEKMQLTDSNNVSMKTIIWKNVCNAEYKSQSSLNLTGADNGYIDALYNFELSGAISKGTNPSFTLNGTVTGNLRAENGNKSSWCNFVITASAKEIVYLQTTMGWSKPVSGTLTISSPHEITTVLFTSGTARITSQLTNGGAGIDITVTL